MQTQKQTPMAAPSCTDASVAVNLNEWSELDSMLIIAQWRTAGTYGDVGAWGCCLAGDWAAEKIGVKNWNDSKARNGPKMATHGASAVEDALSSLLGAMCEAGSQVGLPMVSASLSAAGLGRTSAVMSTATYGRAQRREVLALGAAEKFFGGCAHLREVGSGKASMMGDHAMLRCALAPIRASWAERRALNELESGEPGSGSKRL